MRRAGTVFLFLLMVLGPRSSADEKVLRIRTWRESGPPDQCVDILFVGDGYAAKHLTPQGKFWKDVNRYAKRLLKEPPFRWYKDRFNVRAAFVRSKHEGCDLSPVSNKVVTALECHFDRPDGRLLVFRRSKRLKEIAERAGPVDVIFVMVNTEKYGGAGTVLYELMVRGRPCPAPTFSACDTPSFLIAIHELGHSFADLADSYVDEEAPVATAPRYDAADGAVGGQCLRALRQADLVRERGDVLRPVRRARTRSVRCRRPGERGGVR